MRAPASLGRWLLLPFLFAACGEDNILLIRRDAGSMQPTSDAAEDDDAGDLTDGTRACSRSPGAACVENGAACILDVECCSSRCVASVCLDPGTCAGPGSTCTTRSDCCSGRCEVTPGTTTRVCLNYCLADGAACTAALDCCSMGCHAGTCGAPLCGAEEATCSTGADCCSGICSTTDGKCRSAGTGQVCHATGTSCDIEDGSVTPCCGQCSSNLERCTFGPGPCLPTGAICTQDSDCCRGTCAAGAGSVGVCAAPCSADGASCAQDADCCGHHCTGQPGTCGPAVTCKHIGAACAQDVECCSGQCLDGSCGSNCEVE
jgi:hypothetical protein